MKVAIIFVALLGCTFADFIRVNLSKESAELNWADITPNNIYVEPENPQPVLPDNRIIGGTTAQRNAFPYQVALIVNSGSFCGSSLISTRWLLTAAHCVDTANTIQAILGAHNVNSVEASQVSVRASSLAIHASWNSNTLQNDIAVIQLASTVTLSNVIRTIALAPATAGDYAGSSAILTGWGRTSDTSNSISSTLQQVSLQVISNLICRLSFGSTINTNHICTSGVGSIGACNGDSGGPLVVNGVQVGVVSFGSSRCSAGNPSVFARVSHFRNWITSATGV